VHSTAPRRPGAAARTVARVTGEPTLVRPRTAFDRDLQIERLYWRGKRVERELDNFAAQAQIEGRLRLVFDEDLGEVGIVDGEPKGAFGHQEYDSGTDISTVKVNSRLWNSTDPHLREQARVSLLHELSHARSALSTKVGTHRGTPAFIEEFGAHMDHVAAELWIRGPTSSVKTSTLRAFEAQGKLGVARNIFNKSPAYPEMFTSRQIKAELGRPIQSFDEMLQYDQGMRRLFTEGIE
jgi:hypothetical protein